MTVQADKQLAAALRRLEILALREAFDPSHPESRPTIGQSAVIEDFGHIKQQWIRAGNQSGKSQTCARLVTWVLTDSHPSWTKPVEWGEEPLLALVAGRTGKQIEDSLLPKLRSFLEPGTYKEVRIGNIIQRLELDNGNRIVFQSLENPTVARERLMSYVAHVTWVDELPPTIELVREVLVRTQARNGYSLFSFTPTVVNVDIQRFVDSLALPEGKVYRFHMLDNPLYSDPERKTQLLARYAHLPEDQQRAIFEGEWLSGDNQVYYFNYNSMVQVPQGYSPMWRHVEAVDPAMKSALGLTIWAEDPNTARWYCILSRYLKGLYAPSDWVNAVREITSKYNIVRRISDPHEPWYIHQAGTMGIHYMGVYSKNNRKDELIKGLQQKLGQQVFLTPASEDLISEIQECRWSDKADGKIVNSSSYHLLDSAQYFCDNIPSPDGGRKLELGNWHAELLKANQKRVAIEEAVAQKAAGKRGGQTRIWRKRSWS